VRRQEKKERKEMKEKENGTHLIYHPHYRDRAEWTNNASLPPPSSLPLLFWSHPTTAPETKQIPLEYPSGYP
jgi:hypothetical protein